MEGHWSEQAHIPYFQPICFGLIPAEATQEQPLAYVVKHFLMGEPRFHWHTLFPLWNDVRTIADASGIFEIAKTTPLLKWEDSISMMKSILSAWQRHTKREDKTPVRGPSKESVALEKIQKELSEKTNKAVKRILQKIKTEEKKAQSAKDAIDDFMHRHQAAIAHHKENLQKARETARKYKDRIQNFDELQAKFREIEIKLEEWDARIALKSKLIDEKMAVIGEDAKERKERLEELFLKKPVNFKKNWRSFGPRSKNLGLRFPPLKTKSVRPKQKLKKSA